MRTMCVVVPLSRRDPCISANQVCFEDVDALDSKSHVISSETHSLAVMQ